MLELACSLVGLLAIFAIAVIPRRRSQIAAPSRENILKAYEQFRLEAELLSTGLEEFNTIEKKLGVSRVNTNPFAGVAENSANANVIRFKRQG